MLLLNAKLRGAAGCWLLLLLLLLVLLRADGCLLLRPVRCCCCMLPVCWKCYSSLLCAVATSTAAFMVFAFRAWLLLPSILFACCCSCCHSSYYCCCIRWLRPPGWLLLGAAGCHLLPHSAAACSCRNSSCWMLLLRPVPPLPQKMRYAIVWCPTDWD